LRDHDTADVLAGLLFAGYSVSGRSGADRAAAWVTATATPPSADPERFAPGVRLRGKTARVAALLDHHDDGVVWVGLQHGVDIRRGLARSPVTQPTLAGLVTWWQLTDELPATLEPDAAGLVAEAVSAIAGELRSTPWADVVEVLRTTLAGAAAAGTALTVALADSSTGDAETEGALPALLSADPMPAALRS